ncbi:MAG TPA: hypothetical protein VMT30_00245 [Candidatus Saccharimonadia bacterium]|nr:hypothetical protein [Candidatus Saccharimonadia bacterium]
MWRAARELGPVLMVAVGVSLVSTFAGAWLDHIHQVDAESRANKLVVAAPGPDGSQTLTVGEWGVTLVLPLARQLPLVSYAGQGGSGIGLSAEDVRKLGEACGADHNALGALLRLPGGSFVASSRHNGVDYFIATLAGYDYVYHVAPTACLDTPGAVGVVNRETSIIREAMTTLAPTSR